MEENIEINDIEIFDFYDDTPEVGGEFRMTTFDFFVWVDNGGDPEEFKGKKFYESRVKYITPTGGAIIELLDEDAFTDMGIETSLFSGADIKEVYPDFEGDDKTMYSVPYEEGSPFYIEED